VLIDMNGKVANAEVENVTISSSRGNETEKQDESQSPESKDLRESALTAARQWKFTPAQFEGKPISAWITIPFRFKLSTGVKTSHDEKVIKKIVGEILDGTGKSKEFVAEKADLIFGKQNVNLLDVLNGKYPKIKLVEGKGAVCVESNISSLGDANALVIWKSKLPAGRGERFHSIQLRKMENAWKVIFWHVSW
jgi:TonB family protein